MSNISWIQKAVNFTIASVKHGLDGLHCVNDSDYEHRLTVCHSCPELSAEYECNVCGCPVETKAMWRSEKCPLGKWVSHPLNSKESPSEARGEPPKGLGGCECGGSVPPRLG